MKVYLLDMFERVLGILEVEAFTTANQNEEDVERELELIPLNVKVVIFCNLTQILVELLGG